MVYFDYKGKKVLVTGSGRGIGKNVAQAFCQAGAEVTLCSRTQSELSDAVRECEGMPGKASYYVCDVSDEEQLTQMHNQLSDSKSLPDILINCAGMFDLGRSEEFDNEIWDTLQDVNSKSTFMSCKLFGKHMLESGTGKIVNFGSLLSFCAFPERAAYAASKAAVVQLTKVLGIEWASRGVCVNAVIPGMIQIETPHPLIKQGKIVSDEIVKRIPAGRRGLPQDITGSVLFLASPLADYITAQTLVVDGGWLSYGYL